MKDKEPASWQEMKKQVDYFILNTQEARTLSEKCRDYKDGKQWTEEEKIKLKKRKQAPIVNNRIKVKVQGLLGLVASRKTDPKAYPRTKKHEHAAEAFTDALVYVADYSHYQDVKMAVAENIFVEGYGGAVIKVEEGKEGVPEVVIEQIPWDRIYYDPHSLKKNFSDARYKGMFVWMDEAEIKEKMPKVDLSGLEYNKAIDETMEDRPRWYVSGERKRYLVAHHYYIEKGVWMMCIFTEGGFLVEPMESPYLDDNGKPCCPIEIESAYIDREGARYGEVAAFLDLQDEINHRRSKALFLLSQRQTFANKGAIQDKDLSKIKSELAKPDGHLLINSGEFGKDFGILPTGDMATGQFELLQEAKQEIDAQSYNAQLSGERQKGDLSGKAIQQLQQAGVNELNGLFLSLNSWELRVYRQAWARVKQFWDQEKWIRVTDDQDNLRWVGLNSQITMKDFLQETMEDESLPKETRMGASAQLIMLEQSNPQALGEIIEVRNQVAEIDLDIILDQSFDAVNNDQAQFEMLIQYGAQAGIDLLDLIELSQVRGKDELVERIEKRRKEAVESGSGQQQIAALQAQLQDKQASEQAKLQIEQQKLQLDAQKIETENQKVQVDLMRAETDQFKAQADVELKKYELDKQAQQPEKTEVAPQPPQIPPISINLAKSEGDLLKERADAEIERSEKAALISAIKNIGDEVTQSLSNLTQAVNAPKQVIRGDDGRVIGVQ